MTYVVRWLLRGSDSPCHCEERRRSDVAIRILIDGQERSGLPRPVCALVSQRHTLFDGYCEVPTLHVIARSDEGATRQSVFPFQIPSAKPILSFSIVNSPLSIFFPQPLWNVENFLCITGPSKNCHIPLWKTGIFSTTPCGRISLAALRQNPLFHIRFYYYCYC